MITKHIFLDMEMANILNVIRIQQNRKVLSALGNLKDTDNTRLLSILHLRYGKV